MQTFVKFLKDLKPSNKHSYNSWQVAPSLVLVVAGISHFQAQHRQPPTTDKFITLIRWPQARHRQQLILAFTRDFLKESLYQHAQWPTLDHTKALSNKIYKQCMQKVGLPNIRDMQKQIPCCGVILHTIAFLLLSQLVFIASWPEGQFHLLMCQQQSRSTPTGEHK